MSVQIESSPSKHRAFSRVRTLIPEFRRDLVPSDIELTWRITPSMIDVLCEHLDGPISVNTSKAVRMRKVQSLIRRGLLCAQPNSVLRPHWTILTRFGREYLAVVLAKIADELDHPFT